MSCESIEIPVAGGDAALSAGRAKLDRLRVPALIFSIYFLAAVAGVWVFSAFGSANPISSPSLVYLLLPFILWAAARDRTNIIAQGIAQRERAEAEIRASQSALHDSENRRQDLAARLIRIQEDERTRIARELHDDVNQRLAVLSMSMSSLKRRLPENSDACRELEEIRQRTVSLSDDVRNLSHGLHSAVLQNAGLAPALRAHCGELRQQKGMITSFTLDDNVGAVSSDVSLCLYRVAQEAMSNVVRHAGATHVDVRLSEHDGELELSVADDGRGFDLSSPAASRGLGLVSIDERVRMVHGRVKIDSRPQNGTTLRVWVPRE
jgi:signal transduction histidine kinase